MHSSRPTPRGTPRSAQPAACAVAITLALAGGVVACSSGDAPEASPTASGPGPLSDYLSSVSLQVADLKSANAQLNIATQEKIAVCMTEKGFEYTPQPYAQPGDSPPMEPDNEAWVAQYGFGSAGGFGDAPFTPPANPNTPYINSLSETAQNAYWSAFSGSEPLPEGEDFTVEDMYTKTGCIGEATRLVDEEEAVEDPYDSPEFEELTTAIQEMAGAALREPEMIDLAAQWSSCMADAGFTFASRDAMRDAMTLMRNHVPFPHEDGAAQALAAADEEEIATALADLSCRNEVTWDTTVAQVQRNLEERFIVDHKVELDDLIAATEASKQK